MKRLQLLLLWVWMVCFSAASHDYMFKHLEVKDGLSNNQVNAIYKDSNGFMWFGTASGLNRYDGYNIKIYRSQKDDEKSLPDSLSRIYKKMRPVICGYVREVGMPFTTRLPMFLTVMWKLGCGTSV